MDNHILVKEMISNNVTNESFTFSLAHDHPRKSDCANPDYNTNSDCRKSSYNVSRFTMAYEKNRGQHEHELFFDMDINFPFTWGEPHEPDVESHTIFLQDNNVESAEGISMESPNLSPAEGHEFEFHIGFTDSASRSDGNYMGEALSPADELFYKGQLLPLQLPPRQHMVERLLSLDSNLTEEDDLDVGAMDNKNLGYIPTLAEPIHRERHISPYPYNCYDLAVGEDKVRRPNLTIIRSTTPFLHGRSKDEHDSNVFPGCYKDPALQMIQYGHMHPYAEGPPSPDGRCRSSTGCAVLLPSSKRLDCADLGFWGENCDVLDFRRVKEAKNRGFSMLKLRAPASFFKAFFNSRDPAGLLGHQIVKSRHYRGAPKAVQTEGREEEEEEEEEDVGHLASYYQRGSEHGWSAYKDNKPLKFSSREAQEKDKILKKARVYLHKYVKLFKSMYVLLSHTHQEQSKILLAECSSLEYGMSTCSSVSSSSSSSSRKAAKQGKVTNYMEPKSTLKCTSASESNLRATSFSKRRVKRNSETMHARFHDEGATDCSTILGDTRCGSSSCVEVESPIQGAIAHCKQSSALPGTNQKLLSSHVD